MDAIRLRFSSLHYFNAARGRGEVAALFFQNAELRVIQGGKAARGERERAKHEAHHDQDKTRSRG